jgi:hypothetical protein
VQHKATLLVFLHVSVLRWSRSTLPILVLLRGRGFTPTLIFSLGPYAHPLLAPDLVPHAKAGSHGSIGFFVRCENSSSRLLRSILFVICAVCFCEQLLSGLVLELPDKKLDFS